MFSSILRDKDGKIKQRSVVITKESYRSVISGYTECDALKIAIGELLGLSQKKISEIARLSKKILTDETKVRVKSNGSNDDTIETPKVFDPREEFDKLKQSDNQMHKIFALYWAAKRFDIKTQEQFKAYLFSGKNVASAKRLTAFSIEDITETMRRVDKHAKENGYRWDLGTVYSFIIK